MSEKISIVRRLRLEANALGEFQAYASREYQRLLLDAADEIEQLRKERDEARRSCCEYAAIVDGADTTEGMESGRFYKIAMNYMKDRGWDCFKDAPAVKTLKGIVVSKGKAIPPKFDIEENDNV